MNHYEISIQVNLNQVYGKNACGCLPDGSAQGDATLYGILPDQAAVDRVMAKLCELGIELVLANTHSSLVTDFVDELSAMAEPAPVLYLN